MLLIKLKNATCSKHFNYQCENETRRGEKRRDATVSKSNKVRAIKLYFWLANCRRICCCLAWLNSCCCCCCCFDSCATFLPIAVASTSKSRFSTQAARSSQLVLLHISHHNLFSRVECLLHVFGCVVVVVESSDDTSRCVTQLLLLCQKQSQRQQK